MTHLFIGAGQAGGNLVDAIFQFKSTQKVARPIAINSAARDFAQLRNIRRDKWFCITKNGLVSGTESKATFEDRCTGGFGKDPTEASRVVGTHFQSLKEILEEPVKVELETAKKKQDEANKNKEEVHHIPFALLFLGFGGGTGSGASPHIAQALKELSNNDLNIFVIGVLPVASDLQGVWNARYSITRLMEFADSFILVDNQCIAHRADFMALYKSYNDYIARCIVDLFVDLMIERIDPAQYPSNPQTIDIRDILKATDGPGFAVLGRAGEITRSLFQYYIPVGSHTKVDTFNLCMNATRRLTVTNVDLLKAEKNLALLRLPPYYLEKAERLDFKDVDDFLIGRTTRGAHKFGVSYTKRNLISLTSLFTFKYHDLVRLQEIEALANEYERRVELSEELERKKEQ